MSALSALNLDMGPASSDSSKPKVTSSSASSFDSARYRSLEVAGKTSVADSKQVVTARPSFGASASSRHRSSERTLTRDERATTTKLPLRDSRSIEALPKPLQIQYGKRVALCSDQHFLAFHDNKDPQNDAAGLDAPAKTSGSMRLTADANSNADDAVAMFKLVNVHFRDHVGSLRFGDTIALVASNGMYVAAARSGGGGGPGLYRRAFGGNEKWTIVSVVEKRERSAKRGRRPKRHDDGREKQQVGTGMQMMLYNERTGRYLAVRRPKLKRDGSPTSPKWHLAAVDIGDDDDGSCTMVWTILKPHTPALSLCNAGASAASDASASAQQTVTTLRKFTPALQEHILLEDVLYALMGVEGLHIRLKRTFLENRESVVPSRFFVDRSLSGMDPSLSFLVGRLLPLCDAYYAVSNFVKSHMQYSFGKTVHALCSAIRELLKEYTLLIAQLEQQYRSRQLTLQKLWYFLQPCFSTLTSLAQLCAEARDAVGGALLNVIKRVSTLGGDERRAKLFSFLIERASVPFLGMLERWIYAGIIDDPYEEFMIAERSDISKEALNEHFNSSYWKERYAVRQDYVPWFLRDANNMVQTNILTTGKYLNVVRECGRPVRCPSSRSISYADRDEFVSIVGTAYEFASEKLLSLLMKESNLLAHLKSIKEFFFLSRGDLFVHFVDTASEELEKDASEVDLAKLESLLKLSLETASTSTNPHKENLTCSMERYQLHRHLEAIHAASQSTSASEGMLSATALLRGDNGDLEIDGAADKRKKTGSKSPYSRRRRVAAASSSDGGWNGGERLTGIQAFAFGYKVEWPLTLVLSRQSLIKYQILFRHLFYCKHVENQLCRVWLHMQSTKELDIRGAMGPSYSLRQRMIHFVQNLLYYVTVEVLEHRWHEFEANLRGVKTVDDVMSLHSNFLDTCLKESLLTNQALHGIVTKLMSTCLLFATEMMRFYDDVDITESKSGKIERWSERRSPRFSRATGTARMEFSMRQFKKKKKSDKQKTIGADEERKTRIETQSRHIRKSVTQSSYIRMLRGFGDNFDSLLKRFIASLRDEAHAEYHLHLSNMFTRLNFNNFYSMDVSGPSSLRN